MVNVDRLTWKGALSQCLMRGWLNLDTYEDFN